MASLGEGSLKKSYLRLPRDFWQARLANSLPVMVLGKGAIMACVE